MGVGCPTRPGGTTAEARALTLQHAGQHQHNPRARCLADRGRQTNSCYVSRFAVTTIIDPPAPTPHKRAGNVRHGAGAPALHSCRSIPAAAWHGKAAGIQSASARPPEQRAGRLPVVTYTRARTHDPHAAAAHMTAGTSCCCRLAATAMPAARRQSLRHWHVTATVTHRRQPGNRCHHRASGCPARSPLERRRWYEQRDSSSGSNSESGIGSGGGISGSSGQITGALRTVATVRHHTRVHTRALDT